MSYRGAMPPERIEVGENPTTCGYCGGRTEYLSTIVETGERQECCVGCGQRYIVSDEDDPDELGEIEVVDEKTGAVVGTTAPARPGCTVPELDELLAQLKDEPRFEPSEMAMKEASQADLNHLFGIKPAPASPYGDDFGSFG